MQIYLISDNHDTLVGMRLAGIDGTVVHTAEDVEASIKKAVKDENIGIVLITERLVSLCPELIYKIKVDYRRPLLVEIPDRHAEGRTKDSITRYVREAIGVKI